MDTKSFLQESLPKYNQEKTSSSKDLAASAEKEVFVSADKERADDEEKQVTPDSSPEMILEDGRKQAIDDEGSKEVASLVSSVSMPEKQVSRRPRKNRTVVCWSIVGLLALVVALAVGLGVGLGVTSHHHSDSTISPPTSTALDDAVPIATPANVNLPVGTYALALNAPEQTQAACLPQNQTAAWNCSLMSSPDLGVTIEQASDGTKGAHIFSTANDTVVTYGSQASSMNTSTARFLSVKDNEHPDYGTAFYFQNVYNKVVVVPEDDLSTSISKRRVQQRQALSPGDKPWFCVFNDTLLEGFIYPEEKSVSTSMATATATATFSPSSTASASQDKVSLEPFPFAFKLREQRTSGSFWKAYCQQYQILEGGKANWIADEDGNPIMIHLEESGSNEQRAVVAERDVTGGCQCQWMSD